MRFLGIVTSRGAARARAKNMKRINSIVVKKCGIMKRKFDTSEPCILTVIDELEGRFSYHIEVDSGENPASTSGPTRRDLRAE